MNEMAYAIKLNDVDLAKKLLMKDCDQILNFKDNKRGINFLMLACLSGSYDIVKLLLLAGASPKQKDSRGNMPLHYAVKAGSIECLVLLLKNGSPLFVKNEKGFTPLKMAFMFGYQEMIQFLDVKASYNNPKIRIS